MQETLNEQSQGNSVEDFLNFDLLDRALQAKVCNLISTTMRDYNASTAAQKTKDNELFYTAKITMTSAHLKYVQLHLFRQ